MMKEEKMRLGMTNNSYEVKKNFFWFNLLRKWRLKKKMAFFHAKMAFFSIDYFMQFFSPGQTGQSLFYVALR